MAKWTIYVLIALLATLDVSGHGINDCGYYRCHGQMCRGVSIRTVTPPSPPTPSPTPPKPKPAAKGTYYYMPSSNSSRIQTHYGNSRTNGTFKVPSFLKNMDILIPEQEGKKKPKKVNPAAKVPGSWFKSSSLAPESWYMMRYAYFKDLYDSTQDKNSNLAKYYLSMMKEYEEKLKRK